MCAVATCTRHDSTQRPSLHVVLPTRHIVRVQGDPKDPNKASILSRCMHPLHKAQALRRFGAFRCIRLQPALPVEGLVLAALEAQEALGRWKVGMWLGG